jgi:transglutaminase-like putative cysteine protease
MMQLRIVHTTGFEYSGRAAASYNQARLTPWSSMFQIVMHHRIEVSPKPWIFDHKDYFGNQVTFFEVVDPHESMRVTATSTVQITRPTQRPDVLAWGALGNRDVADRWVEFLVQPDLVAPPADFKTQVAQIGAVSATPAAAARAVCDLVRAQVSYCPGSTEVRDIAGVAWEQKAGISQDMVHLAIGGLRSLGIPARYVSGYFHPSADPAIGVTTLAESHAWLEWWDDAWTPYDPTNGVVPGDTYVAVAKGRDYIDAKPISGIYSGAETSSMFVSVEITRMA